MAQMHLAVLSPRALVTPYSLAKTAGVDRSFHSLAVTVGNEKQSSPFVGRSHIGRGYREPDRIHPERGKVPKDGIESCGSKADDILHDCESGSNFAKDSLVLRPKAASITSKASPRAGD